MANYISLFDTLYSGAQWDVGVAINRNNGLPLDRNSIFPSLALAKAYARKSATDMAAELASLGINTTISNNAYPGQVIAVVTESDAKAYIIQADSTLKEVGGTVDLSDYVKKSSFSSSAVGYLPKIKDANTIEPGYVVNAGTAWGGSDSTVATTLAIDNRIKSYYWADVKISNASSTETSPTVKNLSATTVKIGNAATWQYNSSTDCIELVW